MCDKGECYEKSLGLIKDILFLTGSHIRRGLDALCLEDSTSGETLMLFVWRIESNSLHSLESDTLGVSWEGESVEEMYEGR